jgi:urease subunit gamma/beta
MELTPSEQDRLLIFTAAQLARTRRARGVLLNLPEAVALISDAILEAARDGASHAEARLAGSTSVTAADLLPGVATMLAGISVEAVFDDGRRLVVVDGPSENEQPSGSSPGAVVRLTPHSTPHRPTVTLAVRNTATVPISVTTHFHFFEVNPRLTFDRAAAYGMHLAIPAGEHVDFPPGATVEVSLTPIAGDRVVIGFAGLVDGPLDQPGMRERALQRAQALGYLEQGSP